MRYFIKLNGNKIESLFKGSTLNEQQIQEKLDEDYIEIDESQGELVNIDIPQKYIDNKVIIDENEVIIQQEREKINQQLAELYLNLSSTDYIIIKIMEGVASQNEYAEMLENRKQWRIQINNLQSQLEEL